jgi:hypothetical protein
MTKLGRQAWWSAVKSGVCAATIVAAACGGAESPRTQAETQPQPQVEGAARVTENGGNKDIESYAGNVDIVTGDAKDYASVDASVKAGDINAGAFGEAQSGLFRRLTWSGTGKYTLRASLTAGNLTLRDK